jgi:LPXTG-site transpeptidase (sortase) family protein
MTVVQSQLSGAPSAPDSRTGYAGTSPPARQSQHLLTPAAAARLVASSAVLILAASLLGFAGWLAFGSRLYYARVQHDDYASFRAELAQATAPTGPTDPANPKKLLAFGTPVAVLSIPEIALNAVVLEGTTSEVLEGGPGHLRDSQMPGQAGVSEILGRRVAYGSPFARLSNLSPGAIFTVTTGQGVTRYRVLDVRRVGDVVPPLTPGKGRLILVTADGPPFAPTGVVRVDADTTSAPKPAPQMVVSGADIGPGELVFGTEPIAWVPLVLWGQALVLAALGISWLRSRWGRWQTWTVAVPVLGYFGLAVADQVTRLLPNLM